VVEWRHGDEIVLEPNPYAWRKPHLKRLIYKIVPDTNTLFVQIRTHAVDVASTLTDEQVGRARAMGGMTIIETPQNHTDFIEFQTQQPPTNNPLVRRALLEAIDREQIAKKVYRGLHPLATTEIPASLWAHDSSVTPVSFDPAQARRDLARSGWDAATPLQFAYIGSNEEARLLATQVQANLAAIGVKLTLRAYPSTIYYAPAAAGGISRGGRFNLSYSDWFGGADPEQSETYRCADRAPSGPNSGRWCSPAYDALYEQQAITTNRAARQRAFSKMQQMVRDNYVDDFLVYQSAFTALNPAVRGYKPNMLFNWGNSQDWDL
jgi:peptide/nickel transport system substrate-binding protein